MQTNHEMIYYRWPNKNLKESLRVNLLVDRLHEFLQSLEVQSELLNQLSSILLVVHIEKLLSDVFDLVSQCLLRFWSWIPIGTKLCLESLGEHVLFQVHNFHDFFLEMLQTLS